MEARVGFTEGLARASSRHPWLTIGAWVLVLVGAFLLAGSLNLSDTGGVDTSDARRAAALLREESGADPVAVEYVLVEAADGALDEEQLASVVGAIVADMRAIPVVTAVVSYLDGAPPLLTADGRKAMIQVTTNIGSRDDLEPADPILDVIEAANADSGLRVTSIGDMSVAVVFAEMTEETFLKGEVIGIAMAMVIMLVVFGAVVAALIPLFLAIVAVFTTVGVIAAITLQWELNTFTVIVATMVGLAVGIDYSLFIVQRFREERDRGLERHDAIAVAAATASRTVLFSGIAVAIALAGMLIMPDPLFKSFGVGTIVVVVVSVVSALTLLPALLGLLGDRVNGLTLPFFGRRRDPQSGAGVWARSLGWSRPTP